MEDEVQASSSTWLIYPAESMSAVVLLCLETGFTEIKIITISALESGSIDRDRLTAITPVFKKDDKKMTKSF